jgi:monovalent cation:proton antiporter-2 (CPA2) family protein
MGLLGEAAIFLAAAVIAVPLFRRLRLGSVLGYLAAGMAIGPWGLRLITDVENILQFATLGVVMLLFVIGLELQPSRLWVLRRSVFGFGTAQVAATAAAVAAVGLAFGLPLAAAAFAGFALAMSCTPLALQLLAERGELPARHGRSAFSILLFQDLSVIPVLTVIPFLGAGAAIASGTDAWSGALTAIGVVVAVIVAGMTLLRPALRLVAHSRIPEVFTAATLLVIIGVALIMSGAGLSMALGAFIAGVLLSDSEFRHELEANIEPFKGLLLGLFFISVGMYADLGLLVRHPLEILAAVAGLVVLKAAILYALARRAGHARGSALNLGVVLSQGGEWAFVLFPLAVANAIIDSSLADAMVIVVTLSMVLTPIAFVLMDRVQLRLARGPAPERAEPVDMAASAVIIAGFGRFGQIVGRVLRARRIAFTALDRNPDQVDTVRRFGTEAYFGDASRLDLLRAANAADARLFVIAIDDVESSLRTAETLRRHFPHLKIYARARDRFHAHRLMDIGVDYIVRETLMSSLELSEQLLRASGLPAWDAKDTVATFRRVDERMLEKQHAVYHDETRMIQTSKEAAQELEGIFESDAQTADAASSRPAFAPDDVR